VDVVVDVKAIVAWVVVVAGSDSLGVQAEARSPKASIDKRKRRIGEEYRRPTTDDRRPTTDDRREIARFRRSTRSFYPPAVRDARAALATMQGDNAKPTGLVPLGASP
jgi:hypothetical protein